jgi:pimeloyl-ACP methyl ester carboxylesterase
MRCLSAQRALLRLVSFFVDIADFAITAQAIHCCFFASTFFLVPTPKKTTPVNIDIGRLDQTQLIQLLASGEQQWLLSGYFGAAEYTLLRRLARRALALKPSKARVYVLPGIMGSTLGTKTQRSAHTVWLNPTAIAAGELLSLALPAKPGLQALQPMWPTYLKLTLHLRVAGYDAVLQAFDWRKSVVIAAKQLSQRILNDAAQQVVLIGHSMGGLVARAALAGNARDRIARVVQLGSPNFGSFALVQALRGTYPTVRKTAALDPQHSTAQLVRHVFRTLPGLYEMLPAAERSGDLDLSQLSSWPDDLLGPDATLLDSGTKLRKRLPAAGNACFHIVGIAQSTVTAIRKLRHGFSYGITYDGDGTVPRTLAEWPGATTYYAAERHGNLPNSDAINKAIIDLLNSGKTRRLATTLNTPKQAVVRWVTDKELRRGTVGGARGKVHWLELTAEERRRILEPVMSTEFLKAARY